MIVAAYALLVAVAGVLLHDGPTVFIGLVVATLAYRVTL